MSLTQIAVCLEAIWLIIVSQTSVSPLLTLIFGLVALVLVILDAAPWRHA